MPNFGERIHRLLGGALSCAMMPWILTPAISQAQHTMPLPAPVLPPVPAGVHASSEFGIPFVTVRGGSEQFVGDEYSPFLGDVPRFGVVPNDYRIGRTEVTHGQFLPFLNLLSEQFDRVPVSMRPGLLNTNNFGDYYMRQDDAYSGPGKRWRLVEGSVHVPVALQSWISAAMYTNWLNNGRPGDIRETFSGAYDLTRIDDLGTPLQRVRSPGSQFWIPSADEWTRAAFFNPQTATYNASAFPDDATNRYGMPGEGLSGAGTGILWPAGTYTMQSPSGVLNVSGGAYEWGEFAWPIQPELVGVVSGRMRLGTSDLSYIPTQFVLDSPGWFVYEVNIAASGFRVAAAIPAPPPVIGFMSIVFVCLKRRRSSWFV